MAPDDFDGLREELGSGEAMLFTGAGFSAGAEDRNGDPIPTTPGVTKELWDLCFPNEQQDQSTLTDLFHYASRHCPKELDALLRKRLCVSPDALDESYQRWFSVPWKRAWTLNVDDIEHAAAKRFGLKRDIRTVSALTTRFRSELLEGDALPFIHLNGFIADGAQHMTFSTTQYGDRLAKSDPWYERFVQDLVSAPFVLVGTRLEESPFWRILHANFGRHVEEQVELCRAVIVTKHLTRARQMLLQDLGIRWLPMSAREFAHKVLDPPLVQRTRRGDEGTELAPGASSTP